MADAYILAARGFSPLQFLPHLLWKQLLVLVALTLPATAVATVTRNVAQFVLIGLLIGAGVVLMNAYVGGIASPSPEYFGEPLAYRLLALLLITAGALALIFLQFSRRRTTLSRGIGIAAVVCASLAFAELPRNTAAAIDCALLPATFPSQPVVRIASGKPSNLRYFANAGGAVTILAPIEFSGLPGGQVARGSLTELIIDDGAGAHYSAMINPGYAPARRPVVQASVTVYTDQVLSRLFVRIDRAVYTRLQNSNAIVRGVIRIDYLTRGAEVTMPIGTQMDLSGWGKCSSMTQPSDFETGLKVDCESPRDIPFLIPVRLAVPSSGEQGLGPWSSFLGGAYSSSQYPSMIWLSPLNHRDAFFSVAPAGTPAQRAGRSWRIPEELLSSAQITVSSRSPAGSALVRFEFPLAQLKDYVLPPR